MKREGYLSTLSVIAVLLMGELDNSGSEFGITKPPWIGAVSWIVWLISHYTIQGSVILCVVTALSALVTRTPSRIIPPTVLVAIGTLFYLINDALEDVMQWFNFERVTVTVNGVETPIGYGTIPGEYTVPYYVVNTVPFWIFLLTIVPYSYHTYQLHLADKKRQESEGITYGDAAEADFPIRAQGGGDAAQSLTVLLRGERHESALPGLYTPLRL